MDEEEANTLFECDDKIDGKEGYIGFDDDGEILFNAPYSNCDIVVCQEVSRKLYEAMKKYYEEGE